MSDSMRTASVGVERESKHKGGVNCGLFKMGVDNSIEQTRRGTGIDDLPLKRNKEMRELQPKTERKKRRVEKNTPRGYETKQKKKKALKSDDGK